MEIRIKTEDEFRSNVVKIEIRTDPLDTIEVVNRLLGRPSLSEAGLEYERLREALSVSNQRVVDIQQKADAEYGRAEANKEWAERAELRAEKAEMANKNLIRDHGQQREVVLRQLSRVRDEVNSPVPNVQNIRDIVS